MNYHTPLEQFLYDTGIAMPGDVGRIASKIEHSAWLAAHDAEVRAGVVTEEPEWEYAWEADEDVRTTTRPRGPRILFDGVPYPPETIASFARGRRIRRRKAGPWVEVADA